MAKNTPCLLFLAALLSVPLAAAERPNVLFILVDDLGYMDIGANNPDTFYETPNIDRLAASGMRFTDGYAANPVCSPTRYSIMTGRYPTRAGATNWFAGVRDVLPVEYPDVPVASQLLHQASPSNRRRSSSCGSVITPSVPKPTRR